MDTNMSNSDAREMEVDRLYANLIARYPTYVGTARLDHLRRTEYARLDSLKQVYLDYTGGSLYAESQLQKHFDLLRSGLFGNPHSGNPSSVAMTEHVERTRQFILSYFGTSINDHVLVFTQNATASLKLVGESFPFASGSRCLLTFDNHNSVNGIREFARAKGAAILYAPLQTPSLRLDLPQLDSLLAQADPAAFNLFAYPAQSNFSGVKHPLDLVAKAQAKGWRVLLDAAAFAPTSLLDLAKVNPDFVSLSFYKMFGYPTGVGALFIRRSMFRALRRPWFAGGTIDFASVQGQAHVLSSNEAAFEDGTLNYLSIPAVEIGLRHLQSIGMDVIGERVRCLTGWLLEQLLSLRHSNSSPMVRVYGPSTAENRGGTIAFNLYDRDGHPLHYRRVEQLAAKEGISLRTGCFCNPGAGEMAGGLTEEDMNAGLALGSTINLLSFSQLMQERGDKSAGSIRASVGVATNFPDVWRLLRFISTFRDQTIHSVGNPVTVDDSCQIGREGT